MIYNYWLIDDYAYSFIFLKVATVEGDIRLIYRNIQYLKILSKITGNVAINRKTTL